MKNYFIRLRPYVELKKTGRRIRNNATKFIQANYGGSLGVVFIGLGAIFLALLVFVNIADYSIITYKHNAISKAMDYAINAAVQEIDSNQGTQTLANGFSDDTGSKCLDGVMINIDRAKKTFITAFNENYICSDFSIDGNLLLCATHTDNQELCYEIKDDNGQITNGCVDSPELLEDKLNQAIINYSASNAHLIFINGNDKTNIIEKGTYLFAFIKDIKIKGLYSKRNTCLSSFAGAKVDRHA